MDEVNVPPQLHAAAGGDCARRPKTITVVKGASRAVIGRFCQTVR
jgi:hypothetical protein